MLTLLLLPVLHMVPLAAIPFENGAVLAFFDCGWTVPIGEEEGVEEHRHHWSVFMNS